MSVSPSFQRVIHETGFNAERLAVNSPALLAVGPDTVRLWFFGGSWEGREDVGLWSQVLRHGDDGAWRSEPETLVWRLAGHSIGNAVPVRLDDGRLWLFVVTSSPGSWDDGQVWRLVSTDGGATYGPPGLWRETPGTLVGTAPLRAGDDTWLVPLYDERRWRAWTVRLGGPDLDLLDEGPPISTPRGCIQLTLAEAASGQFHGYLRTRDGESYRVDSADGVHFGPAVPTGIPNPNARIAVSTVNGQPSDSVVLVYNPNAQGQLFLDEERLSSGRTCLRAALSRDGGLTFPRVWRRDLAVGSGEYGYPWILPMETRLLVAYQAHRAAIRVAELSPAWLTDPHPLVDPETFDEAVADVRATAAQHDRPKV